MKPNATSSSTAAFSGRFVTSDPSWAGKDAGAEDRGKATVRVQTMDGCYEATVREHPNGETE
jgi:hypothetical protein